MLSHSDSPRRRSAFPPPKCGRSNNEYSGRTNEILLTTQIFVFGNRPVRSKIDPLLTGTLCCWLFRGLAILGGVRAVAERNAAWERRPQQIISRGTFHEWPETLRAIHPCARRPLFGCQERGEKYGWIWRGRLHRF